MEAFLSIYTDVLPPPDVVVVEDEEDVQFPGVPITLAQVSPDEHEEADDQFPVVHVLVVTLVRQIFVPVPYSVLL